MFHSMLKKRRSGQIRAVDFVVSLFLFLLMLSQLLLIIISVQTRIINSEIEPITYDELDIIGRRILQEEGQPYWGYQKSLPEAFGLADTNSLFHLTLDPAKIARLITGTSFPVPTVSGFQVYNYDLLKEVISLKNDHDFQLAFFPCFNVEVQVSSVDLTTNSAEVLVLNSNDVPISNARVHFFTIDLTNGNVTFERTILTNSTGGASNFYPEPHVNIPGGEHIVYVIAEKDRLWGMNWDHLDSGQLLIGSLSDITLWGGGINSSTLVVADRIATGTPDNHFLSIIYQNTLSNFSSHVIDLNTDVHGNETIPIPNEGLCSFFSIVRVDNSYQVGIGSYPAVLDSDETGGLFYNVFGEQIPEEKVKALISKVYPVIIRGTLMRCQITLWRE